MKMKFVLFLLCVFVVIQGLEANSVKDKVERGLSDVWEAIKSSGRKIKEIYNDIGYYIPRHMQNLKNMARHTKDLIPQLTDSYKRKFQALTSQIKDISSKCYAVNQRDLSNLNNEAGRKLRHCNADLKMQRISLSLMMDNLTRQTRETKEKIGRAVKYCFSQHSWWKASPLFHCISERLDETLGQLKDSVHKSFGVVKDAVEAATVDLAKCVTRAQKELYDKEKELFVSVKECVRNRGAFSGPDESYTVTEREVSYNREPKISSGIYTTPYSVPISSSSYSGYQTTEKDRYYITERASPRPVPTSLAYDDDYYDY